MTNLCKMCGETKPKSEFSPDKRNKSGVQSKCKSCMNAAYNKKYCSEGPKKSWAHMLDRVRRIDHPYYSHYGGRGITICSEWFDYNHFKDWALANGWEPGLTIDRIDNDGNYEPSNCRWVNRRENTIKRNLEYDYTKRKPFNEWKPRRN